MGHYLVTAPAVEPVTTEEFKSHIRLDADDSVIPDILESARVYIEEYTALSLVSQVWCYTLDDIPGSTTEWWDGVRDGSISELQSTVKSIPLPRAPLISVDSFLYYDNLDNSVEFTGFYTDISSIPGRVCLRNGGSWPIATRGVNGLEITYTSGYASTPADLKHALKIIAAHWYENRELMTFDTSTRDVPLSAMAILNKHRRYRL